MCCIREKQHTNHEDSGIVWMIPPALLPQIDKTTKADSGNMLSDMALCTAAAEMDYRRASTTIDTSSTGRRDMPRNRTTAPKNNSGKCATGAPD